MPVAAEGDTVAVNLVLWPAVEEVVDAESAVVVAVRLDELHVSVIALEVLVAYVDDPA
ncbi:MAG: hypothetical protein P4L40_24455 [Terracidiphilus sp.]|nr:hypothetical protein [Terracidiphilus sp.]